ncbi:UNVERIFIED_ORG: hypothetical protein M2348_004159 [Sphingomonas sp. R1F5B]
MIGAALVLAGALLATLHLVRRWGVLRRFAALGLAGRRALRVLARRRASDCWKERAARLLAIHLMGRSLVAGGALALAALPLVLALGLGPRLGLPTTAALLDPWVRLAILVAGICLAFVRFALARSRASDAGRRARLSPA